MMNHKAYLFLIGILFLAMTACGGGASPGAGAGSPGGENPGVSAASSGGENPGAGVGSPGGANPGAGAASPGGANSGAGGPGGNAGPGGAIPAGGGEGVEMPDMDMGDLPIDENGNISVSITDEQANELLAAQSTQSTETSQIENAEVAFTTAGIVFTGVVSGQDLYVLFWPYIENGTIQLDVVEATLGGMDVPAELLDEAETAVNESLSTAMGSVDAITLQSILVTDGLLTVTGSING